MHKFLCSSLVLILLLLHLVSAVDADDLGYEGLGTYGSGDYKTPVLDKMHN